MINYIAEVHGHQMVSLNSPLRDCRDTTKTMVKAFIPNSSVQRSIALLRRNIATYI
jgi:hypothetical protein